MGPSRCFNGREIVRGRPSQRRSGLWNRPPTEWPWVLAPVGEENHGFGASLAGPFGANLASRPPRTPGGGTLAPKTITKGEARGAGGRRQKEGWHRGRYIFRAPSERSAPLHQNILRFYRFFGETRLRDTPQKSRGNLPPRQKIRSYLRLYVASHANAAFGLVPP